MKSYLFVIALAADEIVVLSIVETWELLRSQKLWISKYLLVCNLAEAQVAAQY